MYLDSAILVKLVIQEWDSEFFADVVEGQRNVCSSELAIVECRSALLRKLSMGYIDKRDYSNAWSRIQALWANGGSVELLPVSMSVLKEACETIHRCAGQVPLRSLDAIHVASCIWYRRYPLIANDGVMRNAAGVVGLPMGLLPDRSS
jgi:predicted nucleic acid-binding protein